MSSVNSAGPMAEGNLAKTPFLHLVLYLHRQRSNGTLVIQHHGRETKVLFRDGRAVAARPVPRGSTLQPGLLPLCKLTDAPYSFWEEDLVEGAPAVVKGTADPYTLVADSLREYARDDVVNAIVDRYMDTPVALQAGADPRRLGLRGQDLTLIDLLQRGPITPALLIEQSILPREHSRRLIYALMITKCVGPVDAGSSASGVRQAVTVSPPWAASSPPPPERRTASGRPTSNPPRGSTTPPPSSGSVPASVPAWKSLATLRPPGGGAASSRPPPRNPTPAQGTPPPRPLSAAPPPLEELDDGGKFRRVEQLVESRSLEEAERILAQLIERHPGNADYLAMRAWLVFCGATGPKVPPILLDAINLALRADEKHPRALYTKAMTLKRMGREADAMRYFQRVAKYDPKHLEARRELRLMQMRKKR